MSLLRAGRNPDGTRHTIDLGPGRGRVAGHGAGLPLSEALTFVKVTPRPKPPPPPPVAPLPRPICGAALSLNQHAKLDERCARTPGHNPGHRSRWALDTARNQRRTNRPLGGIR